MQLQMRALFLAAAVAEASLGVGPAAREEGARSGEPAPGEVETSVKLASKAIHADLDADGVEDVFTIGGSGAGPGEGRLLVGLGNGRYEDRTVPMGLGHVGALRAGLAHDLNADGYPDLVLLPHEGEVRLFQGAGSVFVDRTAALGLGPSRAWRTLALEDRDLDGRTDVVAVAKDPADRSRLSVAFHRGGWRFEVRSGVGPSSVSTLAAELPDRTSERAVVCADDLVDQAGGPCLEASSVPTLGKLFPIGPKLFVDPVFQRVGIGTTAPTNSRLRIGRSSATSRCSIEQLARSCSLTSRAASRWRRSRSPNRRSRRDCSSLTTRRSSTASLTTLSARR